MTTAMQIPPSTRELWDALLSCEPDAVQEVLSKVKVGEVRKGCEMLVPSSLLWNSEVKDELSALHYVALTGDADVLYDMIWRFKGINLNLQSAYFKWTPMQYAINSGHINVVALLIVNGANVNIQDGEGQSGLHMAVTNANVEILQLLIKHGATVNIQDKKGDTPLHFCLGLLSTSSRGIMPRYRKQMIKNLIGAGASVKLINNLGDTAMHFSLRYNHGAAVCSLLLESQGASECLCIANDMGHIPLQVSEDPETLEMLLLQGSLINYQGPDGRTTLHIRARRPDLVTLLLDYKADADIVDNQGRTPLHVALSDEVTPLESVCHLLMSMCDINVRDNGGNAPLHLACRLKRCLGGTADPIVDLLLNKGAMVNVKNKNGETPLYIAVRHANLCQAEELLMCGASPNIADKHGLTPIAIDPKWASRALPKWLNGNINLDQIWKSSKGKRAFKKKMLSTDTVENSENKTSVNSPHIGQNQRVNFTANNGHPGKIQIVNGDPFTITGDHIGIGDGYAAKSNAINGGHISAHGSHLGETTNMTKQNPGTVKTVCRQLASLRGEVASFCSILEKCADPNSELSNDDLLALIDDEPTPLVKNTSDHTSEDMSYLRKEVVSLAQVLEDTFLEF